MGKRVVIVGAGYAGIHAAMTLRKKRKKAGFSDLQITVIDKNDYHSLLTELHEVAGNRISEDGIIIPLRRIFNATDIEVIKDKIVKYDFAAKKVCSDGTEYKYDYLILAQGSETNFFGIEGAQENSFTLWSYEDALKIRAHIRECFEKAVKCKNDKERQALLTFVVVGAGFTGSEMIGELPYYTRDLAKEFGINRSAITLRLVDAMDKVLPIFGGKLSVKAHKKMEKMGIKITLGAGVKSVTADGVTAGSEHFPSKTVIWTAGVRAHSDVEGMDVEKKRARRLDVNDYCETVHKNVYAIGDIGGLVLDAEKGTMHPAMVETALGTGKGAAENILADLKGSQKQKVKVVNHGAMVCVGSFFAVSDLMGIKFPVWLSIIMKYLVNAHYLWGIVGPGGVAKYFYDEFIYKRQKRHFLENHWSRQMQAWWNFPLRMFLGVMWLYEGIVKVTEHWFTEPKLAAFLGIVKEAAGDATSAATNAGGGVWETVNEQIFRLNIFGLIDFNLGKEIQKVAADGSEIAHKLFAKIQILHYGDFDIVNWFCKYVVVGTDGLAMFFQILVVIMELGVGLCLIGGIFNFPASVVSTGLMVMFLTSTGLYQESWWMLFASIAVMGGAGRAFGLDHYAVPYFNNAYQRWMKTGSCKLKFKGAFSPWDDK